MLPWHLLKALCAETAEAEDVEMTYHPRDLYQLHSDEMHI